MPDYTPKPEHQFAFGLWTVGNVGRDPFGEAVRPQRSPLALVELLADVGAVGVNLHDNDLVPIDASPAERDRLVRDFQAALARTGMRVVSGSANLFYDPVFKDGAYTANDPRVRAYALQKTLRAVDLMAELGGSVYIVWGGREGTESDANKSPVEAVKRAREALNFICAYIQDQGYPLRVALEAKPNEPRGDIFFPTTAAYLAFIETLDYPEMVGVNPEVAHEHMAGLNFSHAVGQAIERGKLFHIDLNDQLFGRYDQDFRFGSMMIKQAFFLVKLLEDNHWRGPSQFDAHAFRTEDDDGVRAFARGCIRSYLILKEKVAQFNQDAEIQALLAEIRADDGTFDYLRGGYNQEKASRLLGESFDRAALAARKLPYEQLDQLTVELLLGAR